MEQEFELIAKTFQGLEEVLATELTKLGANNLQIGRRMVSFTGNKELMYRANFCLRTAVRILKPIKHFKAFNAEDVYKAIKDINWDNYLDLKTTFAIDAVVYSTEFTHSKFVSYKVKDAIVDYFKEKYNDRPNISVSNPDLRLNIHIAEDECTLSLDSSGDSLHIRGYREATVEAPINEVLAAGMIMLSGWDGSCDLIDPMCGSGTILIEAALMARNIWPGIFRKGYAFEKWKDFDSDLFECIYNDDSDECEFNHQIIGYDLNKGAIDAAQMNAKAAGVGDVITFIRRPLEEFTQPENPSLMITNPPYGERISAPDLLGLYRTLGERLKNEFTGNTAWVISYREECFAEIGLKPSFKIPLFNGSLDCEFRKYQLFRGKFKEFRGEGRDIKTSEERSRMAEKKRFKTNRDFKKRLDDNSDEYSSKKNDEDEIPDYIIRNHKRFEEKHSKQPRRFPKREGDSFHSSRRNSDKSSDRSSGRYSERNSDRKYDKSSDRSSGRYSERNSDRKYDKSSDRSSGRYSDRNSDRRYDKSSRFENRRSTRSFDKPNDKRRSFSRTGKPMNNE